MKIVFFGTSSFAARLLTFLLDRGVDIVAVVTRPDRPRGRSLQEGFPPVKEKLLERASHLPVHQPEKASTPEFAELLRAYNADLFIVVAYGEIIKQNILSLPKRGCINVHASLLPAYRGAAPMQRALMDGVKETGITIIDMVLQMDAGDMLHQVKVPVPDEMTLGALDEALCKAAESALLTVLHAFETGTVKRMPQDPALVTFAAKITPEAEQIHWDQSAQKIHNQIRALSPTPGAWCLVRIGAQEKRLKIKRSTVVPNQSASPGTTLSFGKEGWIVACGEGALSLLEVQLEGKKTLLVEEFLRGTQQPPQIVV